MNNQSDQEIHLVDYWRVLSARRRIVIATFLTITVLVAVYSFLSTPSYKGTAQVLFELKANPTMSFVEGEDGYVQIKDSREYFNTQMEIIRSRSFADKVVRRLELDTNPYFINEKRLAEDGFIVSLFGSFSTMVSGLFSSKDSSSDPFPAVLIQEELDPELTDIVLDGMEVEKEGQSNLMKINFLSPNPRVAAIMANGIASTYIVHNLELRVRPFKDAVEWLSSKLVELRSRVEDSERDLQLYKEDEGIVSFESKGNILTQELNELVSSLINLEAERQEAEIKYLEIKSSIDKPELLATVPDIMSNLVIQGLRSDELKLKTRLSELSEKYGHKHPQMKKAVIELETVQENLVLETRKMLSAAKTKYEILKSRENSLVKRVEEQKNEVLNLSRKAIDFNVVAGEAFSNKRFYELLLRKLQEASLSSGINVSNAQIVDYATVPKTPVKPRKGFNILLAMILGLFAGTGSALFLEYMDDTLKTQEDVDTLLGLPFLGYVPHSEQNRKVDTSIFTDPTSNLADAYRSLRTGILLSSVDKTPKVLLVTSPVPSEGKTTTASNLAITMARMGERVLLIDADLRRSGLHRVFGFDNTSGLTEIITGQSALEDNLHTLTDVENLRILTAGVHPPNPAELLVSNKMKDLLDSVRNDYDRIVLDSPPLLTVSDPLSLSSFVDGVVMVVWGGDTSRDIVIEASRALASVNANLIGVLLNKTLSGTSGGYAHYYYTDDSDGDEKKAGS